ncbi:GDSL esterase/lipase-like protein [Drosera capensis]
MGHFSTHFGHSIFTVLIFLICSCKARNPALWNTSKVTSSSPSQVPAVFVFGDSTVDPGNNNYIGTIFTSNYAPYGRDLPNHIPTGRFSNGRLATDFIASDLGVKEYVPPYLDPKLMANELITGVSFASAGSGYDPYTAQLGGVITMQKQLEYFREYKAKIEKLVGKEKSRHIIENAAYIVSAGANDFAFNYYLPPLMSRRNLSVEQYQPFLLQIAQDFVQELWKEGARKIGVVGLAPLGCLPMVITLNTKNITQPRGCLKSPGLVVSSYNQQLQMKLNDIQNQLAVSDQRTKLFYLDINTPTLSYIQDPTRFGFEEVARGCCGTGYLELSFLCNPTTISCPDPSKYVFWDSIHPSQRTCRLVVDTFRPVLDEMKAST